MSFSWCLSLAGSLDFRQNILQMNLAFVISSSSMFDLELTCRCWKSRFQARPMPCFQIQCTTFSRRTVRMSKALVCKPSVAGKEVKKGLSLRVQGLNFTVQTFHIHVHFEVSSRVQSFLFCLAFLYSLEMLQAFVFMCCTVLT